MVTYDYQADPMYHASPTQFSQLLNYADIYIDVYIDRQKERKRERGRGGTSVQFQDIRYSKFICGY